MGMAGADIAIAFLNFPFSISISRVNSDANFYRSLGSGLMVHG